ncbi:PEP-CTERM sorting domain-containing protein [Opitutaceae bacterium TAV4]|nr:PEP-CTERM sorting domain-containing protein [Opitutaceae bacterium TAV4]RRK01147.1 PEP-CTERM sorting domain-containing protein [Opitutaceae bacterium TAV3]
MTSPRTRTLAKITLPLLLLVLAAITTAASAINIVFIGDSITHGGKGNSGNVAYASYRYPLYFQLKGAGHDVNFVGPQNNYNYPETYDLKSGVYPNYYTTFDRDHAGFWGKTSGQLLNSANNGGGKIFYPWVTNIPAADTPDIALINIGTNDASGGVAIATFTANLSSIIGYLRAANPNVTIILSNLMGTNAAWDTSTVTYNTAIANFVADPTNRTLTSSIVLADIRTGSNRTTMLYDNLHPNELGEAFMAGVYFNAITRSLIPEPATLVLIVGVTVLAGTFILRRRHDRPCSSG